MRRKSRRSANRRALGSDSERVSTREGLDGEALATLPATAREHGLAVFRPHPDEEAVGALAAAIVGLKRTLRHGPSPNFMKRAGSIVAPLSTVKQVQLGRQSPQTWLEQRVIPAPKAVVSAQWSVLSAQWSVVGKSGRWSCTSGVRCVLKRR